MVTKYSVSASVQSKQSANTAEVKEDERILRAERFFDHISRTFRLAQDIDDSQSLAQFNEGVPELTLAKKAASSSRRLMIE